MKRVGGGMLRKDDLAANPGDSSSFGAVTLGFATMVFATGAAAQEAAKEEQTVLPTMEVSAKKKAPVKKQAVQKKAPPAAAAVAAPAAPQPTPAEALASDTAGFTPSSGNTLQAGTGIGRMPGTVQDTPQIINVVSEEQLRQQRPTTIEQALRAVPGVTVAIGEGGGGFNGDQFRIRGFEAKGDIYVDGLRDFGVYVRDSFSTEEIQVIKGPSSETFGSGSTGGIINLRQKTAHLGDAASIEFGVGTDGYFRSTLDVNKQINATTASRAVAMYSTQDQPDRDHVEGERWGVLGSIGFGLGTDTTWTVNYLHQEGNRVLDYGVPSVLKPGATTGGLPVTEYGVDRSNFYGVATDHDNTTVNMLTSHFRKDLSDTVTFFNDTRAAFYDRDFMATVPACANATGASSCANQFFAGGDPNLTNGGGNPTLVQHSWGIQNITGATAQFNLFGLRHESVAGVDVFYQEDDRPGYSQYDSNGVIRGTTGAPILNPGAYYNQYYKFGRNPVNDRSSDGTEVGLFASDRVWLNREWSVLAGARWTSFDYNFEQPNATTAFKGGNSSGDFWSPKASLIWEPTKSQTYYFSWGRSASPVGQFVTNILNPLTATTPAGAVEENESYEVGAKISLLDNRLGLTAALFQIEKNGVVASDPAIPDTLIQTGESQRVRGFEVGLTGQLTKAWIANVGYTYLDSEVIDSTAVANIGNDVGGVPHSSVSLWTTYNLSDELISGPGKWTIGSGFLYQSQMFSIAGANTNAYIVPYTFSWDAMLSYELDDWRFAVNGFNLTDRLNYDQSFNNRATPSAGRSAVFSVSKKF